MFRSAVQPEPPSAVAVRPGDNALDTVTNSEAPITPILVTTIESVRAMSPWVNVPEWVALIAKSEFVEMLTVKLLALLVVPPSVLTVIGPETAPFGTTALRFVAETIVNAALRPLKATLVVKLRFVPVTETVWPTKPEAGEKPEMRGGGAGWPSTLLLNTAARFEERAVKKVKPVSA